MQNKKIQQKLKLFLNQPNFLKHYLERNSFISLYKSDKIKTIFPPKAQLQRFSHLQQARNNAARDIGLDSQVYKIVNQFQQRIQINLRHDSKLQIKKQNTLQKLKMDYVEEQMSQNLQQLEKLIQDNKYYSNLMLNQKKYVQKMIVMTQIKKALMAQNIILKKENEMLKNQEEEVDMSLKIKKKN